MLDDSYRQMGVAEDQYIGKTLKIRFDSIVYSIVYGTPCASYMATDAPQQATWDSAADSPVTAEWIHKGGDLMSEVNSLEKAQKLVDLILIILDGAGFVLRKWPSNVP